MTPASGSGEPGPPPAGPAESYVYLDTASSEPLHPAAREVLLAALDQGYADPRRLHRPARSARLLLDNAREVVAEALGVRRDEVTFTSSGTDAVHRGLAGLVRARRRRGSRIVLSAVEHSSVHHAAAWAGEPDVVGVTRDGRVRDVDLVEAAGAPGVAAVALQAANHEVGTVQPVDALGLPDDVPLFVDARASMGRLPLPGAGAALAGSAHLWGGPAGVGVLVVRKGNRWQSPFPDDDRVDERSSGFENVPAALAAAAALQAVVAERDEVNARQHALVDADPAAGRHHPRRRGRRRPGGPAPPPGDLLLPLRRRRGAGHRAGPARLRGRQRLGVHGLDARTQPRAGRDGRAHPRQRPGLAGPRTPPRPRSTRCSPPCPGWSPTSARRPGCERRGRPRARLPRTCCARCR